MYRINGSLLRERSSITKRRKRQEKSSQTKLLLFIVTKSLSNATSIKWNTDEWTIL